MGSRRRLFVLGVAVCLFASLSAGAGTTLVDGESDPEELLVRAVDSLDDGPAEAVQTTQFVRSDGTVETIAVHERSTRGQQFEVIELGTGAGQHIVDDSTVVRHEGNGTTVRYTGPASVLFDDQYLGVDPDEVFEHYESEYAGLETVAGREAHLIELVPPEETTAELSLEVSAASIDYELPLHEVTEEMPYLSIERWWIDAETYYPIKQEVEWSDADGNVIATATKTYEEIAFDPDPSDGALEPDGVDPGDSPAPDERDPDDPSVPDSTDDAADLAVEADAFETKHGVDAAAPVDLSNVGVPGEYTFGGALLGWYDGEYVVRLLYEDADSGTLSVRVTEGDTVPGEMVVAEKPASGIDGTFVVTDGGLEVVRHCDYHTYRVSGPPAAETLLEVTEALECPEGGE